MRRAWLSRVLLAPGCFRAGIRAHGLARARRRRPRRFFARRKGRLPAFPATAAAIPAIPATATASRRGGGGGPLLGCGGARPRAAANLARKRTAREWRGCAHPHFPFPFSRARARGQGHAATFARLLVADADVGELRFTRLELLIAKLPQPRGFFRVSASATSPCRVGAQRLRATPTSHLHKR